MSELADWLRFYRDLGFMDVYAPARSSAAPSGVSGTASAAESPIVETAKPQPEPVMPKAPVPQPPVPATSSEGGNPLPLLEAIRAEIGPDCTRCKLHEGRSKIVFGSGNPAAKLVFVGEGPGADEDAQGLPFVGRAGQLLTQMIEKTAAGEKIPIERKDVYICNVVKCRPPGNRAPEPDEMETCGQFLHRQLEAIQPKAICVLGATAAKALLQTNIGITKMRGNWKEWRGIPVMPTFHPSYLLRAYNKDAKREAWEDLKKVLHRVYD